jgi:hypothetical protein
VFAPRYFAPRYFAPRYFAQAGAPAPEGGFERSRSRIGAAAERAAPQRLGATAEHRAPGRIGPRRH